MIVAGLPAAPTAAAEDGVRYEVTISNLTRGQQFTPILVASHPEGVQLFTLGRPASPELATLAEEGNTGPLTSLLLGLPAVRDVKSSPGLLSPGACPPRRRAAPPARQRRGLAPRPRVASPLGEGLERRAVMSDGALTQRRSPSVEHGPWCVAVPQSMPTYSA